MGGISTPSGTITGLGAGELFCFRSFGKRETGIVVSGCTGGASLTAPFCFGGFAVSRFPIPVSRVRSTTSGCHPTVSKPSAESANSPTSTPPAVPTTWWTPWASSAGTRPTSFCVWLQAAYSAGKRAPVTVPIPYGSRATSPAPSAAARAGDRLPSRSNAARAQPIPRTGSSSDPAPSRRHNREPSCSPQLPVTESRSRVSPRNSPITRAPMPISSWRALRFM